MSADGHICSGCCSCSHHTRLDPGKTLALWTQPSYQLDWSFHLLLSRNLSNRIRNPEFRYTVTKSYANVCKVIFSNDYERPFTLWHLDDQLASLNCRWMRWLCQCQFRHDLPRRFPVALPQTLPLPVRSTTTLRLFQTPSPSLVPWTKYQDMKPSKCQLSSKSFSGKDSSDLVCLLGLLRFCLLPQKMAIYSSSLTVPIPRTEDLIEKTQGSIIFCIIDLWSAHHQIWSLSPIFPRLSGLSEQLHFVISSTWWFLFD